MRILFAGILFLTLEVFAQENKAVVSLSLLNSEGLAVENATAELVRSKDSVLVKTALSDKTGVVIFENVSFQSSFIRITATGYEPLILPGIEPSEKNHSLNLGAFTLKNLSALLQNVTVTARKPFIQKLTDRIVVNVDNSIVSAGSSALEILERSPGITIDQNDAISLRGRAGVIIMIDGKPTAMNGQDLANYLRGLPSHAIERIDIITNPSAKYDAAGNSGIIDIRMKKDQRLGSNGTLTAGYGQGIYPKANGGTSLNYRNSKLNVFGNYNYAYRKNLNHLIINRNFYDNGQLMGSDDKDNYAVMPLHSHTARMGVDFFPNKKTILGMVINGSLTNFDRKAEITTLVNNTNGTADYQFFSLGVNNDQFKNLVGNINVKHRFDSTGKELNADVDMGYFESTSLTRTSSSFYEMNGTPKAPDDVLDGDQHGILNFKTAKVDYTHPLQKEATLEAGMKASYVYSDNDAKFFNVYPSYTKIDSGKTNRFFYREYNYAGYLNFKKAYKKLDYQIGLRGEKTLNRTRQVLGEKKNKMDYFRLFPSAFVNFKVKEDKTIGLSVSKRIDRPGYRDLNPFLLQIDPTIYGTGNPQLKPQMTWSYEMSYTVKNLSFTLGYSHTTDAQNIVLVRIKDVFPDFVIQPGQSENVTVQIPINLSSSDYIGLTATTPFRVSKWWNMINNINIYYNRFNGNLGNVQLNDGTPAANIRTNNNFSFKKGWSAEMNAHLNTGGRSGYMVMESNWGLALGVQKQVLKGKGTIRFNVTDIFWTSLPRAKVTYEGRYVENWHAYRESRVGTINFTYRFGNNKVQQARRRTTGSEEERQRAGS